MVVVAQCLGLRAEEVLALHWSDVDFDHLVIHVSRAVVHGRVKTVKTEYSEDELPLDPDFATVLLAWKSNAAKSELVFPSHVTGRNFHASPIQQDYIRPAGCCLAPCRRVRLAPGAGAQTERENGSAGCMMSAGMLLVSWGESGGIHSPHLPVVARCDGGSVRGAAEADAARPNLDHHERLRQRADGL